MYYNIRHLTQFRYTAPIRENVMEVRMQPRTEGPQVCRQFSLSVAPQARVIAYQDYLGNTVHHFDIPRQHSQLSISAEALVQIEPPPVLPEALAETAWVEVDRLAGQHWHMTQPSHFAHPTALLETLATELKLGRFADPLTVIYHLNTAIARTFAYAPQTTGVDSPIDEALRSRQGVCQDFAHIMIALVRQLGLPCRYVSGYLYHRQADHDRSEEDATHAWVEVFLPELDWIGFDPTNDLLAGERHIRVAVGRDYRDVPPTRGVFKGETETELRVGVRVSLADAPATADDSLALDPWPELPPLDSESQMQAQQQ